MSDSTKTIGVMFGGASAEHDVSIITGQYVLSQLRKVGYQVVPIYVTTDFEWRVGEDLGELKFFKEKQSLDKYAGWHMSTEGGVLTLTRKKGLKQTQYVVDVLFPTFHGTNGEDGALQGFAQFGNIPYVGASMEGSVVAMNKTLTKQVLKDANISTPDYVAFSAHDWKHKSDELVKQVETTLEYPVFIKPPHAGSSIGVSRADSTQELRQGIEVALHYDSHCLVEQGVDKARDITVAVMGNHELETSLLQESHHHGGMLSYEDKYINDGGAQFGGSDEVMTIPAKLPEAVTVEIQEMAKRVYAVLGLSGTSRVDFVVAPDDTFSVIEVNPLPGTLYNHLWEASGLSGTELVSRLVDMALEAHQERNTISYEFNSSILKHANNMKLKVD